MTEQILPIGIDSTLDHVQSEADRIDALFTVPTGPMGFQQVNYHTIDEERQRYSLTLLTSTIAEPFETQRTSGISVTDDRHLHAQNTGKGSILSDLNTGEARNDVKTNRLPARFSLPEIDSSSQHEKNPSTLSVRSALRFASKEAFVSSPTARVLSPIIEEQISPVMAIPEQCRPSIPSDTLQQQAENLLTFFSLDQLAEHNEAADAWVCLFDRIYDLTALLEKIQGTEIFQQFVDFAGQDISILFDEETGEPRCYIDPFTNESASVMHHLSDIQSMGLCFWQNDDHLIGHLIKHPRFIRLVHSFSPHQSYCFEVAEEETVGQIARKFLKYNAHGFSYAWRYDGRALDLTKTLTENGIVNEEFLHDRYGWRSDKENCPTIVLYFADDLTIA